MRKYLLHNADFLNITEARKKRHHWDLNSYYWLFVTLPYVQMTRYNYTLIAQNGRNITKFDMLTTVLPQIPVICYVTLCRLVIVIDVSKGSNVFILRYKQPEKTVLDCLILEANTK